MDGWNLQRTVCMKKKNKEPISLNNLREIQISTWSFKVAEQSRVKLKEWLDEKTDSKCYAFKKKKELKN